MALGRRASATQLAPPPRCRFFLAALPWQAARALEVQAFIRQRPYAAAGNKYIYLLVTINMCSAPSELSNFSTTSPTFAVGRAACAAP